MVTMFVTCTGDSTTRFDREYYVKTHLPLVMETWGPYGLRSAAAYFPATDAAETIAVAICELVDDAAVDAASACPGSDAVMADIGIFTDSEPRHHRTI
jgi:uncharacterized protein (TIGR02118 family)